MSYIRCTTNPEKLYSWDDIDGNIYFNWTDRRGKHKKISIDSKVFNQFMVGLKIVDGYVMCEPLVYQNISIREIFYNASKNCICENPLGNGKQTKDTIEILTCLQIGKEKLLMYDVTWNYFYQNYFYYKSVKELLYDLIKIIYHRTGNWLFDLNYSIKEKIFGKKT